MKSWHQNYAKKWERPLTGAGDEDLKLSTHRFQSLRDEADAAVHRARKMHTVPAQAAAGERREAGGGEGPRKKDQERLLPSDTMEALLRSSVFHQKGREWCSREVC